MLNIFGLVVFLRAGWMVVSYWKSAIYLSQKCWVNLLEAYKKASRTRKIDYSKFPSHHAYLKTFQNADNVHQSGVYSLHIHDLFINKVLVTWLPTQDYWSPIQATAR